MIAKPNAGPLPVVVLVSGRGSNLQALLQACQQGLPLDILAVICNQAGAPALALAKTHGIKTFILTKKDYPERSTYDQALAEIIDGMAPRLIVLAGFMRLLSTEFVNRYLGRLINIHPSLLPAFPGLDTHAKALAAGVHEHGASVHYVIPEVDAGPVIAQVRVPVKKDDTPESLSRRVLQQEHRLYPATLQLIWEGRVQWHEGKALLDGAALSRPLQLNSQGKAEFSNRDTAQF